MKNLITIMTILSFSVTASDTQTIKNVQVQSRHIQTNVNKNHKFHLASEIASPSSHQTTATKRADGKISTICEQKHKHQTHRAVK